MPGPAGLLRAAHMSHRRPQGPAVGTPALVQQHKRRPVLAAKRGVALEATAACRTNLSLRRGCAGGCRVPARVEGVGDELLAVLRARFDARIEATVADGTDSAGRAGQHLLVPL